MAMLKRVLTRCCSRWGEENIFGNCRLSFADTCINIPDCVLDFQVIGPFTHARNTKKFNNSAWESGIADIYTSRASAGLYGETIAIEQELVCARKMETSTISIKGGPYIRDSQINLNVRGCSR